MKKIKVAILSGGPSSEHEVSLNSAGNVLKHLDATKFDILHILISKDGVWIDQTTGQELTEAGGIQQLKKEQVDLVFIIIHGEYGEDGTIQKLLEDAGIRFTGSRSQASATTMDKVASSRILTDSKLNVPSYISIGKGDWDQDAAKFVQAALDTFSLPVVVKPTDRGSSVGTSIVEDERNIESAVNLAFQTSGNVMIQDFIKGTELTCAVIEGKDGKPVPLTPTEIIPNNEHLFFDYAAKYVSGASVEITPPNISKEWIATVQQAAVTAHQELDCSHISRADFILAGDTLYILEVNTIPGMTETSLVPQGAKASGIEFPVLLEILIEAALR
jgi:D-alanine-D-alanine ligase